MNMVIMMIQRIGRIQLARRFYIRLGFLPLDRSFVLNSIQYLQTILVTSNSLVVIVITTPRTTPYLCPTVNPNDRSFASILTTRPDSDLLRNGTLHLVVK